MFRIFKRFKGTNHKQVIPTLIVADPIDKMVEKEMAQLKAMKDEKEREEMSKYKKQITSLEELHQVIDALETLNKKYVITKKIEYRVLPFTDNKYPANVWYVEEIDDTTKVFCDGEESLLPNGKRNGEAVRSMLDKISLQEQKEKECK
ncbi:hypothetical protein [Bacillus wiedmannii]|uniref:Uncharacterized protein n=1 Tax=Bacillus wiedmannii TaxID=1890302 RepID=A0A1C4B516_9BACI|nr:hypothetical protein [Bacillus wiedmannii]SCC01838.1 Uncharacterized protein BC05F1_01117 [Bacillus wiedmannii]